MFITQSTNCWLPLMLIIVPQLAQADVSHLFAVPQELSYFQAQHHHIPTAGVGGITFQQYPIQQSSLSGLYGPPLAAVSPPAPVAPVPISTTTEFSLPEIVDNRSLKPQQQQQQQHYYHHRQQQQQHPQFIPLSKEYLPPAVVPHPAPAATALPPLDDRPNYESPLQPGDQQNDFFNGYHYQKPTITTTRKPSPIVVVESPDLPPINNDPIIINPSNPNNDEQQHQQQQRPQSPVSGGYDYDQPAAEGIASDTPLNRPSTPAPIYLPAARSQYFSGQSNDGTSSSGLRLRIHEMRCLQPQNSVGYFRAVLKLDSFIGATPIVDNDSSDKRCDVKLQKSYLILDVAGEDFSKCGVQQCNDGNDLCLRLRFPAIRGMRTDADAILTLHCKGQNKVAVKTHALKMGVSNVAQARSIGTYAKGGTQNSFRTHVELLKKTQNGYINNLRANEAVQLGEDLILRAHVLNGDGWNYTKLSDVSLQRISPSGEILNSANLVTSYGCLNPSMRGICSQPPAFDAPLGHKLSFKAVMFQGMHSGDELVLSMRITGCLEAHDCYVNAQQCSANLSYQRRRKRDAEPNPASSNSSTEISEISKISFKVIMPEDYDEVASNHNHSIEKTSTNSKNMILIGSLGFTIFLLILGIFAMLKLKK